ncbi:MAG: alpha/beta hydrolase [Acidobacteriota bacterium]
MSGRSNLATLRAAFSLVGAILQGGKGKTHESGAVTCTSRGPLLDGFGPTDVYTPVDAPPARAAVLMMHGLTAGGIRDHRIPTFAATIARGGMPVILPEFPRMKRRLMSTEDPADVLRVARAVPEATGVDKIIMLAMSYAAGPTYLAGTQMGAELAGIVTIGAYYDVEHLSEFTATGGVADYGKDQPTAHDAAKQLEGRWVFLASAGRWLPDPADAEVFAAGVEAWKEGAAPPWDEVRAKLSPEGRNLLDYMTLTDPEGHARARERLDPGVKEAFARLTLRDKLADLTAPVVLIHGRHDVRIPYRESMLLRDELTPHADVRLAILDAFVHAERAYGWSKFWRVAGDGIKLSRCGFQILRWAV